jgi:hypothetical protein
MNDFLYSLAEMKYRMFHELYKFNPQAYTKDECFKRIKYQSRYDQLLDIISLLPLKELQQLHKIEEDYFYDAPYVTKTN